MLDIGGVGRGRFVRNISGANRGGGTRLFHWNKCFISLVFEVACKLEGVVFLSVERNIIGGLCSSFFCTRCLFGAAVDVSGSLDV